MTSVRVRTVTYFTPLTWNDALPEAHRFLDAARRTLTGAGFAVQTARVSAATPLDRVKWKALDRQLGERGLILNAAPVVDPTEIEALPQLVQETRNIFWNFALDEDVGADHFRRLAAAILRIGTETGVEGNFRFCVSSQCPPYIPYFPASYGLSTDAPSFAVGLESSGILHDLDVQNGDVEGALREALTPILQRIEELCKAVEAATGVLFRHIDTSLCPRLEPPAMTDFWQRLGLSEFGAPGTLSICASLTKALKSIPVQKGGYCGLMLPVCEDAGLVEGTHQKAFRINDLLYYSTVCSCGLDCVPVPGYTSDPAENSYREHRIAGYLSDLHTIATRLKKPLACRLLPVSGRSAGERTNFNFQYLLDGSIMDL